MKKEMVARKGSLRIIISILNDFSKCFNQNELKMIYANYEHKGLIEIIKIFKSNCDTIKTNVLETKCDSIL